MFKNQPQSKHEPDIASLSNYKSSPYLNLFVLLTRWTFIHKVYSYTDLWIHLTKFEWINMLLKSKNQVNNNLSSSSEQWYTYTIRCIQM